MDLRKIMKTYLTNLKKNTNISTMKSKRLYCSCQSQDTKDIEEEKEKELKRIAEKASIDDPPTACCRSGCANCVFIVWAETLSAQMEDAGPEIAKKIMENVDDPSLRAYLELELKLRGLQK